MLPCAERDVLSNAEDVKGLEKCAAIIVQQNHQLMARAKERNFNPATELDFTANGAGNYLQRLFEEIARFKEGGVPWQILKDMFITTDALINTLKMRKNAPISEIDAVGVTFRECAILWCDNYSPPRMERRVYLKRIFKGRDAVYSALKVLHAKYVEISVAKGHKKRTMSVAKILEEGIGNDERIRIYREIARQEKLGITAKKAISAMMRGTYAARMSGAKAETWRRYYNDWKRHAALRKSEPINWESEGLNETIKVSIETINETINTGRETINHGHETINETIKDLIVHRPGVTGKDLVTYVGKSRATVMRIVATLKKGGVIIYRGSKKTGGYYVT